MKKQILLFLLLAVLGVALVFTGCEPPGAPIPDPNEVKKEEPAPAPAPAPAEEPKASAGDDVAVLLETITPKFQKKVDDGEITQDTMDLVLERVQDGTYVFEDIQAMMMGMKPFPVRE